VSENAARNQLATACAQQRSQKVNQATPFLSHSPVKAPERERLFGHIAQMPDETDAKQILTASPAGN